MDPRLERLLAASVAVALPMSHRFRDTELRELLLIEGPAGWGEFAPFDDYSAPAASRWLDSAIEAAYGTWPAAVRSEIEVNAIIPAVPEAAEMARIACAEDGCRIAKVRVGIGLAEDEARVSQVRSVLDEVLGPGRGAIRVDAGGAWSPAQAVEAIRVLERYGLEFVEQPCPTLEGIRQVRAAVGVPIAVDEGLRTAVRPDAVQLAEVADIAIIKAAPLGGVRAALKIAEKLGVPAVVSGSLDSGVGLAAGLALAGALPSLPFASGLGTGRLLAADVVDPVLRPRAGRMSVARATPSNLERVRASELTAERLRLRAAEAWFGGTAERMGHLVSD